MVYVIVFIVHRFVYDSVCICFLGIIVESRMSSPPVFDVGIGTNRNVDRNTFSSVRVFCVVETNDTDNVEIRFMVNGMDVPANDPSVTRVDMTSATLTQSLTSDGTIIYTCVAMIGDNKTFTESSVVNVMCTLLIYMYNGTSI